MEAIITAVNIVGVLSVLIIAHELGHFLVAKWCGMHVEDFSLFFGPRLLRIGKFNGTEYNIRSVPLGGYVKIAGMEPDDLVLGAPCSRPSLAHGKPVVMHGLSEDDIVNLRRGEHRRPRSRNRGKCGRGRRAQASLPGGPRGAEGAAPFDQPSTRKSTNISRSCSRQTPTSRIREATTRSRSGSAPQRLSRDRWRACCSR